MNVPLIFVDYFLVSGFLLQMIFNFLGQKILFLSFFSIVGRGCVFVFLNIYFSFESCFFWEGGWGLDRGWLDWIHKVAYEL